MRVMGIAHVYVARDPAPAPPCAPPPADVESLGAPFAGRTEPPPVDLTLAAVGHDGRARPIDRPPGPVRRLDGDARVRVNHFAFSRPNLSIPRGSRVTWRFGGDERHDATLAAGPVGFSSPSVPRRRALVPALRHAGRVPRLLLAAPRLHVAVPARALTRARVERAAQHEAAARGEEGRDDRPAAADDPEHGQHEQDDRRDEQPARGQDELVGTVGARPAR